MASGGIARELTSKEADIQKMLAAEVHLGAKNCDFQMERYVFKRRNDGTFYITFCFFLVFLYFLISRYINQTKPNIFGISRSHRNFNLGKLIILINVVYYSREG